MGHKVGKKTDLKLIDEANSIVELKNVNMTTANRNMIRASRNLAWKKSNPFISSARGYPDWAPFQGLKWKHGKPLVCVDDDWYELVSIHGVTVPEIQKKCRQEGWNFKHRFREDLVQILRLMDYKIDRLTDLELRDENGQIIKRQNVRMTRENLRRMKDNISTDPSALMEDLEKFQRQLELQFSYLKTNGYDYRADVERLRSKIDLGVDLDRFATEVGLIMNQFIDGHASVSSRRFGKSGYLPFLIETSGDQFIAVQPDRSNLVNPDFPFLRKIDGRSIDYWIEKLDAYVPRGSHHYRRRRCLRNMRNIQFYRRELKLAESEQVQFTLANAAGEEMKYDRRLAEKRPLYGEWPRGKSSSILDNNLGYLRLEKMNGDAVDTVQKYMPEFEQTDGLIVDVRGNGGGSRLALMELAPYFLRHSDSPRIGNVAKYRLYEEFGE